MIVPSRQSEGRHQETRIATRSQLLKECAQAGIPILYGAPDEANYGESDEPVLYQVPNLDLATIFALRDRREMPWRYYKTQQEEWGNGILNVQATLHAIRDHYKAHRRMPDHNRSWTLRCSDQYDSKSSFCVHWQPILMGLFVCVTPDNGAHLDTGALPMGIPPALR